MKHFAKLLSVIIVTVIFSANAFAQDLAAITDTYNAAANALKEEKNLDALNGFKKALQDAIALGEEGNGIATDCKAIIPKILVVLGKDNANGNNLDKALEYFNEAIKLGTEYNQTESVNDAKELIPVVIMADANSLLNEGKFAEACNQYNKVIESDPNNATAYLRLGMAQAKLNNETAAVEAYTKAAELGEKDAANKQLSTLYANKAITAYKAKNNAATLENALKANEFGSNATAAKVGGIAAFNLKKYDSAIKLLEEVVAGNSKANDAIYYLARSYEAKGNKAKALENYKKITADPKFKDFAESKIKALGA